MGRWVLRSEIDGEIAKRSFGHIGLTYRLLMQLPAFPGVRPFIRYFERGKKRKNRESDGNTIRVLFGSSAAS
jgi:hypothetical protein